jgi:membrane-bound lytic murein transglycosylase D
MKNLGKPDPLTVLLKNITLLVLGVVFCSCKTTQTKTPVAKAPVEQAPKATAEIQLPVLPDTPAKTVLPTIQQKPSIDPVEQIIQQSMDFFLQGEKNLKAGFLERAKKDFDGSLEVILRSRVSISQDERLERHYESLLDRIHNYEMAALKEGDGFTEERVESAPLDEIAIGEPPLTFDPKSRRLAEETVQQNPHDLPLPINDYVLRYLDYFQHRGRKVIEVGMQRSGRYREMISRILAEEGVPQDLIYLCQAESAFKPLALSRAKCKGLWQFGASRGAEYGLRQNWWIDERSDPEKSTRAAARHLKDLYDQFGDWLLAMAAYNTGPGNIGRAIERTGFADYWELLKRGSLHPETKNYIPIILAMAIISKDPSRYGFEIIPDPSVKAEQVQIDSAIDLRLVAESLDLSLAQAQELNPHVKRLATPRRDPDFTLYVPEGTKDKFLQEIASIPEDMRVNWRKHRVEEGENIILIARKYRTTPSAISQVNSLTPGQKIQLGDKLIIPVTLGRGSGVNRAGGASRVRHTVKRGETVAAIAKEYDVTVGELRKWNKLLANAKLRPGRVLIVQPAETGNSGSLSLDSGKSIVSRNAAGASRRQVVHRVKKGDTLYTIATNYKTTIDSIRDWNKLSENDSLRVGERLTIYLNR